MRKIVLLLHTSLDGFAAGAAGEMDWIKVDEAMFDFVHELTENADTALYGRVTYQMMDAYWPNAADKPKATKHDREHSAWYNKVEKVVVSETLQPSAEKKLQVIAGDLEGNIQKLRSQPGKDILLIGSPSIVRELMELNLIDDYWLFVNPMILGSGISIFATDMARLPLELVEMKRYDNGVAALQFKAVR
ncbi:MAG: dihydrofolate reductase family protein [Chitinophagaceae bacterium]|nr:dihydrofolate reductase family protein [Chitinophagaceae bacterium]